MGKLKLLLVPRPTIVTANADPSPWVRLKVTFAGLAEMLKIKNLPFKLSVNQPAYAKRIALFEFVRQGGVG